MRLGSPGPWLAEDPLLFGMQKGLWRASLDRAAQRLLLAVGLGKIILIEEEQSHRQNCGNRDDRNHETIEADPRCLHGDDFAVAIENAKRDQHCDQHSQRGNLIEHAGRQVDQILADGRERDMVAKDIADQFEEREDQHQQDEPGQDQKKHVQEFANHILIEDAEKARPARDAAPSGAAADPAVQRRPFAFS